MAKGEDSSYGVIFLEGKQLCFTIEDGYRVIKVQDETRIPSGRYNVKFKMSSTPMTKRYRKKFPDWFNHHLELQDVYNFTNCYLHVGNNSSESSGCLLLNKGVTEVNGEYTGSHSVSAYTKFYKLISDTLNKGEEVYIDVRDEVRYT